MMTSRFAGLKKPAVVAPQIAEAAAEALEGKVVQAQGKVAKAPGRAGKKAVVGYFSPELSRTLAQIALDTDSTIQAVLGEAIDDLMRKHGKHPFGER
jgi:hypothetical protein